jgi:hypothetical protein
VNDKELAMTFVRKWSTQARSRGQSFNTCTCNNNLVLSRMSLNLIQNAADRTRRQRRS